jgi:hypothetical protein
MYQKFSFGGLRMQKRFGLRLFLTLLSFVLFQSQIKATDDELNVDTLSEISISREDIYASLNELRKSGKISEIDYQKAKLELGNQSDTELSKLKDKAANLVKEDPKKAAEMLKK